MEEKLSGVGHVHDKTKTTAHYHYIVFKFDAHWYTRSLHPFIAFQFFETITSMHVRATTLRFVISSFGCLVASHILASTRSDKF